jgi:hypothetical protein
VIAAIELGWVLASAAAAAAALVFLALTRFPQGVRFRLYAAAVVFEVLLLMGLWTSDIVVGSTFWWSLVVLLAVPAWAYLARVGFAMTIMIADPLDRRDRGLPQYEGRPPWQWVLLLCISPWHIARYRRHVLADAESPMADLLSRDPKHENGDDS